MNIDEKKQRLTEILNLEVKHKKERNFEALISIIDESMQLLDTIENQIFRIPQKAYCLARLGRKEEAKTALENLGKFSMVLDKDKTFRAVTLVTFFMNSDANHLDLYQKNTIKNWLQDPETFEQVEQLVFDYEDFIDNARPFNKSSFNIRQTQFSTKLIDCVFSSMQRTSDTKIYYNREKNDVQQLVEGYLSSHMAENQTEENIKLRNRIINRDAQDTIINGIHYLIPRLSLINFLDVFESYSSNSNEIKEFISSFKVEIMNGYSNYVKSLNDIAFSDNVAEKFYNSLESWFENNEVYNIDIEDILDKTINEISIKFLIEVNK